MWCTKITMPFLLFKRENCRFRSCGMVKEINFISYLIFCSTIQFSAKILYLFPMSSIFCSSVAVLQYSTLFQRKLQITPCHIFIVLVFDFWSIWESVRLNSIWKPCLSKVNMNRRHCWVTLEIVISRNKNAVHCGIHWFSVRGDKMRVEDIIWKVRDYGNWK